MEQYEINKYLTNFNTNIKELEKALNIEKLNNDINGLTKITESPDFWQDNTKAQNVFSKLNSLKQTYSSFKELESSLSDLNTLLELSLEDTSIDLFAEVEESIYSLQKKLNDFQIQVLLNEPYDDSNAILELHPGAGGTESMDWCEMLYRMYQRYSQRKNFKVDVLDYLPGEEAGIKSITILVKGKNAYGYLKAERGVHRLVRISPFDSNSRRHTSFVSCDVMPEISEVDANDIKILDEDIKVDVYRSSGAGGQSVNTTDSAVRITHKKTGIVVTCQNERSQIKNREIALNILKSKLLQLNLKKQEEELRKLKGEQMEIGWGSQIRSYVFHPYAMVKDHRTNYEVSNTTQVMDGDIDEFINQYLRLKVNKNDS